MRFGVVVACCLLSVAVMGASAQSTPTCADLKLVPAPRECKAVKSVAIGSGGLRVVSEQKIEDEFAADDLAKRLYARGVTEAKRSARTSGMVTIRLERLSAAR